MLLVTCYYNIPSKNSKEFYYSHIERFFKFIDKKIIFFTDEENYHELKKFAKNNIYFCIRSFDSLRIFLEFNKEFWEKQVNIDVEKYHTWELAALWANKKYFIQEASEIYSDNEWYMWIDSGCIRDDKWEKTCINFTKRNYLLQEGIYFQLLNNIPDNKLFFEFPENNYIAGALILFHKNEINNFIKEYNEMLRIYDYNNICGNSDQYIIASLFVKKKKHIKIDLYKFISNEFKSNKIIQTILYNNISSKVIKETKIKNILYNELEEVNEIEKEVNKKETDIQNILYYDEFIENKNINIQVILYNDKFNESKNEKYISILENNVYNENKVEETDIKNSILIFDKWFFFLGVF